MNRQKGVSLSGLLFWGVVVAVVALFAMKIAPSAIEYYKIRKAVTSIAQQAKADSTVSDIRIAYRKYADIDSITDVRAEDLDISKEGNQIVISFSYEKRIGPLGPVSLLIEYRGSSSH